MTNEPVSLMARTYPYGGATPALLAELIAAVGDMPDHCFGDIVGWEYPYEGAYGGADMERAVEEAVAAQRRIEASSPEIQRAGAHTLFTAIQVLDPDRKPESGYKHARAETVSRRSIRLRPKRWFE